MCPHLAGIRAVGFGLSVSAGNVGPIWPASLCPQNSRSWEPHSTWMRLGGKKGTAVLGPRAPKRIDQDRLGPSGFDQSG